MVCGKKNDPYICGIRKNAEFLPLTYLGSIFLLLTVRDHHLFTVRDISLPIILDMVTNIIHFIVITENKFDVYSGGVYHFFFNCPVCKNARYTPKENISYWYI